jgi:hypothetical protein
MVMVPDTAGNVKKCFCLGCPTCANSKLTGILYCGKGKAKEAVNKDGCICPTCPVWKNYKLQSNYFCSIGKAV